MGSPVPAWFVWVDTRIDGEVVQIVDSVFYTRELARARRNRINTEVDVFPNMVAWIEVELTRSRAKLSPNMVREIRRRRANGERGSDLAREFGVNRKTVTEIVSYRAWRDID